MAGLFRPTVGFGAPRGSQRMNPGMPSGLGLFQMNQPVPGAPKVPIEQSPSFQTGRRFFKNAFTPDQIYLHRLLEQLGQRGGEFPLFPGVPGQTIPEVIPGSINKRGFSRGGLFR